MRPDVKHKKSLDKDFKLVSRFVEVYCRRQHGAHHAVLCDGCRDLLQYARKRIERCPHDPKPACRDCTTHCYRPDYREKIRAVMRFSGIYFAKRGRLDYLVKYLLATRGRAALQGKGVPLGVSVQD
jgi:hypothetical protein